jgi:8-oxo-dGTP diphosphatase
VLTALRGPVRWEPHVWNLPSGKADEGEDVITAVIRESAEETGLRLVPADLRLAGVVHLHPVDSRPRVGFAFVAEHDPARHGEPYNPEPDKCDELRWVDVDALPRPFTNYSEAALRLQLDGSTLTVLRRTA